MPLISSNKSAPALSLYQLLDPEVLANPYPLYQRLREEAPVYWDPYLHAWVVTRYEDVVTSSIAWNQPGLVSCTAADAISAALR